MDLASTDTVPIGTGESTSLSEGIKGLKMQFGEQIKVFQSRTDKKLEMVREMSHFFAKLGEIETVYSQSLEKLYERYNTHKKLKKVGGVQDDTPLGGDETQVSVVEAWVTALEQVHTKADKHASLASHFQTEIKTLLDTLEGEITTTSKKCIDLVADIQSDLTKSVKALDESYKTYVSLQAQSGKATGKLEKAQDKGITDAKKGAKLKDKQYTAELRASTARNEYILAISAANTFKKQFFNSDLNQVLDALEYNYHDTIKYVFALYKDLSVISDQQAIGGITSVYVTSQKISSSRDKKKLFAENQMIFSCPDDFTFVPCEGDQVYSVQCLPEEVDELSARYVDLKRKATVLQRQMAIEEENMTAISSLGGKAGTMLGVNRSRKNLDEAVPPVDSAVFYADTCRRYVTRRTAKTVLDTQLALLKQALGDRCPTPSETDLLDPKTLEELESSMKDIPRVQSLRVSPNKPGHRRTKSDTANAQLVSQSSSNSTTLFNIAATTHVVDSSRTMTKEESFHGFDTPLPSSANLLENANKQKLDKKQSNSKLRTNSSALQSNTTDPSLMKYFKFGANLAEACRSLKISVPLILESSITYLRSFMNEEGLFRITGSQAEINEIRDSFEKGLDPFLNASFRPAPESVASALKLYIRMLDDSIIPSANYFQFLQISKISDHRTCLNELKHAIHLLLPHEHVEFLHVLLPFLREIALHSDRNKMTVNNLALVFGPTLMIAKGGDTSALLRDSGPINHLVSVLIENQEWILNASSPVTPPPVLEAVALHPYTARNDQELSVDEGDMVVVLDQSHQEWWRCEFHGKEAYLPASYMRLVLQGLPSSSNSPVPKAVDQEATEGEDDSPEVLKIEGSDLLHTEGFSRDDGVPDEDDGSQEREGYLDIEDTPSLMLTEHNVRDSPAHSRSNSDNFPPAPSESVSHPRYSVDELSEAVHHLHHVPRTDIERYSFDDKTNQPVKLFPNIDSDEDLTVPNPDIRPNPPPADEIRAPPSPLLSSLLARSPQPEKKGVSTSSVLSPKQSAEPKKPVFAAPPANLFMRLAVAPEKPEAVPTGALTGEDLLDRILVLHHDGNDESIDNQQIEEDV